LTFETALFFYLKFKIMNRTSLFVICLLLIFLKGHDNVSAQISLAPTSIFITDQTNIASLYVSNNSQVAQEMSVSFEFSYPGSDNEGNMVTVTNDSACASRYGLTGSMKVFPRQFVLQPGKQQVVRLQVRPSPGKPDGVYWSRVIVSSQTAAKDLDTVKITKGIGTKINYVFKQNIPAFYLKGKVSTGLMPGSVTTSQEKDKLIAIVQVKPTGNAPFNGSVTARLLNGSGKEVIKQQQTLVAYFDAFRRIELPMPATGVTPGKYTLELVYETKRSDIPPTDLIQAKPVKNSVSVEIK
jgi:P pilus assembly chaperone PapD